MKVMIIFLLTSVITFSGFAKALHIEPQGGVFQKPLYVKMSTDSNTTIFYTIDGSVPSSGSLRYTDSILVEDVLVLRAVTYIDGKRTKVQTQSYFTGRDFSLPIVSVVSNPDNFWSFDRGIYVKGCCADSIEPYMGANFWKPWEYECNVEMYTAKGKKCFNQLAGMSLFGGYSRILPQKSLAIIARSKYGKNKFDYPIFKERNNNKYKSFIIRNSGGDFRRTQLRDAFMTQLAKPTGVPIQAYEPAIIYLNGKYWGIQNLREKISEHYLKDKYKVDKDNVDIFRHNGVRRHGFSKHYKFMMGFLRGNNFTNDSIVDSLSTFMDIQEYISYNIAEVYSDNKDAGGNIRYYRERKAGAKWRWIFYDLDMGLSNDDKTGYASNTLKAFTTFSNEAWPNPGWSTFIIRTLLQNKKLEYQYINTFCDYLNTCFHADTALALFNKMAKRIETEIPFHQKRWGRTVEVWHKNLDIVREFVTKRPAYLFQHIDEKFSLDTTIQVSVKMPEGDICDITLNSIKIEKDFKGKYFTNIPQKIIVNPKHDYELIGWKNSSESMSELQFTPTENATFEPIIKARDSSEWQGKIIINELNFTQAEKDSTGDWLEIYNHSGQDVDLTNWLITDRSYKKGFKITEGSLKAGDYIIIAENKQLLSEAYNLDEDKVVGGLHFGLSSKGELIKLYDEKELVVDYVLYDNSYKDLEAPFSLALSNPDSTASKANQWEVQGLSPLKPNPSYLKGLEEAKKRKEAEEMQRNIMLGSGIAVLVLIIVVVLVRRKRKKT